MFPTSRTQRATLALAITIATPALSSAQSFDFTLQPSVSQINVNVDTDLAMPGSLIGNYDATTNPGGTRTLPGLFGGGTNDPVPLNMTVETVIVAADGPTGSFTAAVDTALMTMIVTNLETHMGNGGPAGSADMDLVLDFSTFRTFVPDSLYIGGIPITVPIGLADVSQIDLIQIGPAAGLLVPAAGGGFDFTVLAAVEMSMIIDFNGTPTPVGPIPLALPLTGTIDVGPGGGTASVQALLQDTDTIPTTGLVITDQVFPLPTILPPGGTANLLYSGEITSIFYDLDFDMMIQATSAAPCSATSFCTAAINSTGAGASMSTNGDHSVAANQFELQAGPVPNQPGLFFYSNGQAAGGAGVPFGNGFRCVGAPGAPLIRLPIVNASGSQFAFSPDLTAPPSATGLIQGGSTWNFQCWYRDPLGTGSSFNLSDGIEVTFCP
ncbi:MAG: hypothetical protein ACI841_003762 [Planctomycetota bacterium]|jgi:hypothetical protein